MTPPPDQSALPLPSPETPAGEAAPALTAEVRRGFRAWVWAGTTLTCLVAFYAGAAWAVWQLQQMHDAGPEGRERLAGLLASAWAPALVFGFNLLTYSVPMMAASGWLLTAVIGAGDIGTATKLALITAASGGQTAGELGFYIAGRTGRGLVRDNPHYQRARAWIGHHDTTAMGFLLVMAAIPNPVFKAAGLAAGALRLAAWKFLASVFAGRMIKSLAVMLLGGWFVDAWSWVKGLFVGE